MVNACVCVCALAAPADAANPLAKGKERNRPPPLPPPPSPPSGAVSQTFTTADGLKAGITLDSVAGLTLGADAKVEGKGVVRAVGGQYNSRAGPLLRVRARPAPWAEAVASLHPRTRTAGVTAMLAPAWLATGPGKTATMTVDVSAPYGDPRAATGGKRGALKGAVGMKWGF